MFSWLTSNHLLVDEIVKTKDFMKKVIVQASKNATNDTNQCNRDYIHCMVPNLYMTHIKHNESSFTEKPAFAGVANLYESSQYNHHNSCTEEGSP